MICKSVHHWRFFCPIVFLTIFSRCLRAATMGSFGWTTCLWLECWLRRPTSATATSATSSPSTRTGMRRLALKEKSRRLSNCILKWVLSQTVGDFWRANMERARKTVLSQLSPKKSLSQLWTNRNFGYCRKIRFHSTPMYNVDPSNIEKGVTDWQCLVWACAPWQWEVAQEKVNKSFIR